MSDIGTLTGNVKVGLWSHFSSEMVSRYPPFEKTISKNVNLHVIPASFHFRFDFQQNHFNYFHF